MWNSECEMIVTVRTRREIPHSPFRISISGDSVKSHTQYLWFNTKRRQEIIDITAEVTKEVEASGVREGLVLVSAMHISASVFVNDHESGLWEDILKWLRSEERRVGKECRARGRWHR